MSRICIVSGDGHAGAKVGDYKDYLERKYWSALKELDQEEKEFLLVTEPLSRFSDESLAVVDGRDAIRSGGQSGGWDPARRVREIDAEGVVAEIIHHGHQHVNMPFFSLTNRKKSAELRAVGSRAYHRWLADYMAATNGRAYGVGDPGPCHNMDEAVRELYWLAENGFVSVAVPGVLADNTLPPLYDPYYDPFWTACEELGLVLSVHAGWGFEQGIFFKFADMMLGGQSIEEAAKEGKFVAMAAAQQESRRSPTTLGMEPRRAMWQLMLGGVFDRFPRLKIAFTEIRAEWLPATIRFLDEQIASANVTIRLKPSEYFQRNCYITPSSPKVEEIAMRHEIGVSRFLFGSDYPHPEGTWPNTWDWLRTTLAGVPENEVRMILSGNAFECYALDRKKLLAIADAIGPQPDDILDQSIAVSDKLIGDFDRRAQFKVPPEQIDKTLLGSLVNEDLAALAC